MHAKSKYSNTMPSNPSLCVCFSRFTIPSVAAHERLLGDDVSDEERHWHEKMLQDRKRMHDKEWVESEHPGCQLSGNL